MIKRGQLSIFIIVGLLLLAGVGTLAFYTTLNKSGSINEEAAQRFDIDPLGELRNAVITCMTDSLQQRIPQIAQGGGFLSPDIFRRYESEDYTYWCLQQDNFGCVDRVITRTSMENQLADALRKDVESCIDWKTIESVGFNVEYGNMSATVAIAPLNTDAVLQWPVTLRRDDQELRQDEFALDYDSELGMVYELALHILYRELREGAFDKDAWMNSHAGSFSIDKHRPYPDTIYRINKYNELTRTELIFRFSLQGEDTAEDQSYRPQPFPLSGCEMPDGTLHAQTDEQRCIEVGGLIKDSPPATWQGTAVFPRTSGLDTGDDCGYYEDGESWCEYQGPVGLGLDYVGTRHFLKSCHNGVIFTEECKDYREELCTQTTDDPTRAICRTNRWEDCSLQTNQGACEDQSARDCYWADSLQGSSHASYGRSNRQLCHPMVPPGFKHWNADQDSIDICSMANDMRRCDGFNCPAGWKEASAISCYMQGDCGDYRNVNNEITREGFSSVDKSDEAFYRDYIFPPDDAIKPSMRLSLELEVSRLPDYDFTHINPVASPLLIQQDQISFIQEASGWDECDVCHCVLGIPVPGCKFKKTWHASNTCDVWEAPENSNQCKTCGAPGQPCTEYWCRSIGRNCYYLENDDGMGTCQNRPNNIAPLKVEDITFPAGFSATADLYYYGGKAYKIHRMTPKARPYDLLTATVTLNRPARCEVRDLSTDIIGGTLYYQSGSPKKSHNVSLYGVPGSVMVKPFLENAGFTNAVEAATIDSIDHRIDQFFSDNPLLAGRYSGAARDWRDYVEPELEETIEETHSFVQERALDVVQNKMRLEVSCSDTMGFDTDPVIIEFDLLDDEFGPAILNQTASGGSGPIFQILLNEPADCRYDSVDNTFDTMQHTMECPFALTGVQFAQTSCYGKRKELGDNYTGPVFIRCRDGPSSWKGFNVSLNMTGNLTLRAPINPRYIKLISPDTIMINKTSSGVSQLPPFEVADFTTRLQFRFEDPKTCGFDGVVQGLGSVPAFVCGPRGVSWGCDVEVPSVPLPGTNTSIMTYPIRCRSINTAANEASFQLQI